MTFIACAGSTAPPRSPDDDAEECPVSLRNDTAYQTDIHLICDVDRHIAAENSNALDVAQKRDDYLVEHVKHPDAIYFLTLFRSKPDSERADLLKRRALDLQIKKCPLAEQLLLASAGDGQH
ncbi:MAG: hypothetical protein ACOY0T_00800 [Myxococcota bacterium]